MCEWQVKRRERTRQLIELGGLVVKAGLVGLTDDDRATLYGAFLTVAAKLRSDEREQAMLLWRRRGQRALPIAIIISPADCASLQPNSDLPRTLRSLYAPIQYSTAHPNAPPCH